MKWGENLHPHLLHFTGAAVRVPAMSRSEPRLSIACFPTRVPIKSSLGSFDPFLMRLQWTTRPTAPLREHAQRTGRVYGQRACAARRARSQCGDEASKEVSQQDGKLRQVCAQAREFPESYIVHPTSYIGSNLRLLHHLLGVLFLGRMCCFPLFDAQI